MKVPCLVPAAELRERPTKLSAEELAWFSIENYDPIENWSLADWTRNLQFRFVLSGLLDTPKMRGDSPLDELILWVLDHPAQSAVRKRTSSLAKGTGRVWDFTVRDVYEGMDWERDEFKDVLEAAKQWTIESRSGAADPQEPELLTRSYDDLLIERFGRNTHPARVFVDLKSSDERLVRDFQEWLARKRATRRMTTPKKNIAEADLRTWHRYRVMALIDLDLLCKRNNASITNYLLGDCLFPNERDVDLGERVRKVVRPIAKQLMRNEYLSAIDDQVSRTEQKSQ